MESTLAAKLEKNKFFMSVRKFLMSKLCVFIQLLISIGIIIIRYNGDDMPIVYGVVGFVLLEAVILFFCDDIIATTPPFMFISTIAIKCYDSFDLYIKFWWMAIPIAAALIFHFVVYRRKLIIGKLLYPYIAVAATVTLGGVGIISLKDYFNGTSLYYTVGLGVGMLFMYILLSTHLHTSKLYNLRIRISYIMMATGILCSFMVFFQYFMYRDIVISEFRIIYMQWRNNVSTILMLVLPFPFYVSTRKYPYFFLGLIEYAAILLSGSRGGAMFGTIEFALCIIVLVYTDKRNRAKNLAVITTLTIIACMLARTVIRFFDPTIQRFLEGDSIRSNLIQRALGDFKSNVVFGRGLGYSGNNDVYDGKSMSINWYHSSPFQIIGSFGILGIIAFVYQFLARCRLLLSNVTHFNLTLFISFIGLTMMSTVNPGEFCPIPYAFLVTMFFVVCEKCNAATKRENGNETEDVIIKF